MWLCHYCLANEAAGFLVTTEAMDDHKPENAFGSLATPDGGVGVGYLAIAGAQGLIAFLRSSSNSAFSRYNTGPLPKTQISRVPNLIEVFTALAAVRTAVALVRPSLCRHLVRRDKWS